MFMGALEQKPRIDGEKKKKKNISTLTSKRLAENSASLFVENQNHLESIFQTRFLALSRLRFKEHPGD